MTVLDTALALLAAVLAVEWVGARQDAWVALLGRLDALHGEEQALTVALEEADRAARALRHAAALRVWR
jgi:hypothetical protein